MLVNDVTYLVDLQLRFPQFPLVALHVAFQLQVMVLEAADQMSHLPVDRS